MSDRLRGAFINTEPALCSIHESGLQVFSCIGGSAAYDLDYINFDEIDQERLAADEGVHLKAGIVGSRTVRPAYDFWVLNYHNSTMAPYFSRDLVAKLKGPRFAIVLEVEPGAPLAFAERGAFDGYLVLDPSAKPTHEVFPFPRPLTSAVERPSVRKGTVPVIGSFGMGTPGKGFEQVVEAVNREFDRAIVRINVPPSTYADGPMFGVHGESYADHLKRLCEYIAKPGVEIRFTQSFMDNETLLRWCGDNDLNLFLYSRRQSGLSATTDQAVASGRPLLVSSNDTFRHIHPYIAPYPLTSLKDAIAGGSAAVARLQKDWSREAFADRFLSMLETAGVLPARGSAKAGDREVRRSSRRSLTLVVRSPSSRSGDLFHYDNRVMDALRRMGDSEVVDASSTEIPELAASLIWNKPDVILTVGGETVEDAVRLSEYKGGIKALALAEASADEGLDPLAIVPRRPLVPYFTTLAHLPEGLPQICLIGFAGTASELEIVLAKVLREMGAAIVNIIASPSDGPAVRRRLEQFSHQLMFTPGVEIRTFDLDRSAASLISFFGSQRVIVFGHDPRAPEDILSLVELALTTERAVVFAGASIPAFKGREPRFLDFWMPDLFTYAAAIQIGLVCDFNEGAFLASVKGQLAGSPISAESPGLPWRSAGTVPTPNAVVSATGAAWYADDEYTDMFVRPLQPAYLKALLGFMRVVLGRFGDGHSEILVYGPLDRLPASIASASELVEAGGDRDTGDAVALILGTRMLSGPKDAEALLTDAIARLAAGGIAAFGFFFRDDYAQFDDRENVDFPTITRAGIEGILSNLPVDLVGGAVWETDQPVLTPDPFAPPPLATLVIRKREARARTAS